MFGERTCEKIFYYKVIFEAPLTDDCHKLYWVLVFIAHHFRKQNTVAL